MSDIDDELPPDATVAARHHEVVPVEGALEQLRNMTFDCMVMDLNLPDFSGYELLTKMAETEEISFPPVIVYTGRTLTGDEEGPSDGQSQGKDRERE